MANAPDDSKAMKVSNNSIPLPKLGNSKVANPSGKGMLAKLLADAGIGGNPEDGSSA